jgi:hypothetical protein
LLKVPLHLVPGASHGQLLKFNFKPITFKIH